MQKIIKSIIVFLFIFVLLVFYNSLNRETNYSTDYLVGNKLTNINLKSFDDNKIYTSEDIQKSRYTLINFWASWCAPCRIEHPYLMQLSKEKNLKILGGIMGSDILDVAGVKNVATLPSLDEARAKIVGILRSPAQKIASILLAPASKIAILALEKSKK